MEAVFCSANFWKKRVGSYRIQVNQSKSKRSDSFSRAFQDGRPAAAGSARGTKKEEDLDIPSL
jgi:hypothetical protein